MEKVEKENTAAFIRNVIRDRQKHEADLKQAASLEERVKPIQNSLAIQILMDGLQVFDCIPNASVTTRSDLQDNSNDQNLRVHAGVSNSSRYSRDIDGEIDLLIYPSGQIILQSAADQSSEGYAASWSLLKKEKHLFKADEMKFLNSDEQVKLADSILQDIGNVFAAKNPFFKEGFDVAMYAIRQKYEGFKSDAANSVKPAGANMRPENSMAGTRFATLSS